MREEHYVWMDVTSFPGRFIVPRSDPMVYEYPADLLFDDIKSANEWRESELDPVLYDDEDEFAYVRSWVLCRRTVESVSALDSEVSVR